MKKTELPQEFLTRMKELLGGRFEEFLLFYEQKPLKGVRLNTLKCDEETLRASLPFELKSAPFSEVSFYAPPEAKLGSLAAHHAGMIYSQEPSASSAVSILAPQKGDKVLDLCAAPGGKSTQIAAALDGNGLLWANEIVFSRAQVLLSNVERMGVKNAVVSSSHPEKLCGSLQGYFDKVLVDAPCSGEGMFRKDSDAIAHWSVEHVKACAERQSAILDSAALALRAGGELVYSTCTFSREENEGVIFSFLERHKEFEIVPLDVRFGEKSAELSAVRIYPFNGGEGHFVSKLRKTAGEGGYIADYVFTEDKKLQAEARELYEGIFCDELTSRIVQVKEKLMLLPDILPDLSNLGVLRAGVLLGTLKGKRIEPEHAVFMAQRTENCRRVLDFSTDDESLSAYLRGEEIDCAEKGYTAVCVNGVATGFGKASNSRLKNRYPKGLRNK